MIALYSFGKKFNTMFFYVSMPYFVAWILWLELRIYSQGVRFFDKFENIIHELRWKPNFNFESISNKFLQILILKLYF